MQVVRRGSSGESVLEVRQLLARLGLLRNSDPGARERFDDAAELAVRHFQQRRALSVDGVVGPETYAALIAANWRLGDRVLAHEPAQLLTGDDVSALQQQFIELGYNLIRDDGVFGASTAKALRSFQRDYGLVPDGVCGPATLHALRQLARRVVGGSPQMLRELVAVAVSGPNLLGKRVVVDPGHGGGEPGVEIGGVTEAELTWDLATRLDGRLAAVGVRSWLTRGAHVGRSDAERAAFANEVGADVVLSLHVDGSGSPRPNGLATYYYGTEGSHSTIVERLADLARRELVARTGLTDGRTHGKTWTLLRLTRMPTVRVEVGYLTSPVDRPRLLDPLFRDVVAEGLLVAVQRLYLATTDDPPTGVMRLPAIAG